MIIRRYKNADCDMVAKLFYETVHSVNAKDYTEEQLSVWANNADSLKSRRNDLLTVLSSVLAALIKKDI